MSETQINSEVRIATLLALASGLALEIRTGGKLQMSRHGNGIKGARIQGVIPATGRYTRVQALKATIEAIKELVPDYEPNPFVKRALES